MTSTAPDSKQPSSISKTVLSHRNRVAAARLRVTVDRQRGTETPAWIKQLANETRAG